MHVLGGVSLTHSGFLFFSLCHEAHTNTQEDVGSSEEEFMEEEEEDRDKDCVSEEDLLSQVGPYHVPQHHEIIPLSTLGWRVAGLGQIISRIVLTKK